MPNIHNVLADLWNEFGWNQTLRQDLMNENQSILKFRIQMNGLTAGLPAGTVMQRAVDIEIIGNTPTLIRNDLFTGVRMTEIMDWIALRGNITY